MKRNHEFTLVLRGSRTLEANLEDALFEAGCDDALLGVRNGVLYLDFDREGSSLEEAVLSAVKDVLRSAAGLQISHVEPDDLVSASEIARRLGKSREYVRLLIQGERGRGDFPTPRSGVTGHSCIWSWFAVARWLAEGGDPEGDSRLHAARAIRIINQTLESLNHSTASKVCQKLAQVLRADALASG